MKKIIVRIIIYLIPLTALILLIDLASFTDVGDRFLSRIFISQNYRHVGSVQISPAIKATQAESTHTKIVLGDSMTNHVFNEFADQNEDYLLLGTNLAVTLDGQYILSKLFLDTHPEATDVYLIMLPLSFSGRYDSPQSYSYLIEPFGRAQTLTFLSDDTLNGMKEYYGPFFLNKNVIRFLDGSSINNKLYLYYLQKQRQQADHDNEAMISDEAAYYLKEIDKLCKERKVTFHLLPAPVSASADNADRISRLKQAAAEDPELSALFKKYFDCITLYPEHMFPDGNHFGGEYADPDIYSDCIDDLQERSGELKGLKHKVE